MNPKELSYTGQSNVLTNRDGLRPPADGPEVIEKVDGWAWQKGVKDGVEWISGPTWQFSEKDQGPMSNPHPAILKILRLHPLRSEEPDDG